jgi:hypothetical protein
MPTGRNLSAGFQSEALESVPDVRVSPEPEMSPDAKWQMFLQPGARMNLAGVPGCTHCGVHAREAFMTGFIYTCQAM